MHRIFHSQFMTVSFASLRIWLVMRQIWSRFHHFRFHVPNPVFRFRAPKPVIRFACEIWFRLYRLNPVYWPFVYQIRFSAFINWSWSFSQIQFPVSWSCTKSDYRSPVSYPVPGLMRQNCFPDSCAKSEISRRPFFTISGFTWIRPSFLALLHIFFFL